MQKKKKIIFNIFILVITLFFSLTLFIKNYFGAIDLEQLFFHIFVPEKANNGNFLIYGLKYVITNTIKIISVYIFLKCILYKEIIIIEIRKYKLNINEIFDKKLGWITFLYFILTLFIFNYNFKLFDYIKHNFSQTKIFEEHYIDPTKVNITFKNDKKNLIYIVVESLEATDFSEVKGGARSKTIIPELEKLANNNISFSNNELLGGFYNSSGAGYTAGSLVSQTAGIPLKLIGNIEGNTYERYKYILKNAYSIGEVLKENGYKNYYIMGSDKSFAGRGDYLEQHGDYEIFDFNTAKKLKYIEEDYDINWWGFEDKKLYEYAKKKLKEISKNNELFNFNLLTVDTHPFGGYLDETCKIDSQLSKYENVFACASTMLNDFINWIKKQSFYKNTTIIIVGDHKNMVIEDIYENISEEYERTIYNAIINSSVETTCYKNRTFTAQDMYPTTLAAIGATIDGDKLSLGTNLFSCKKTLAETIGLDNLNDELAKSSKYYNNCLYYGRCE